MDTPVKIKRLCSEIQLFDLCDKSSCSSKEGKYCTDDRMLSRFEAIKEEDEVSTQYIDTELDDLEEDEDVAYGDISESDDFADEDDD